MKAYEYLILLIPPTPKTGTADQIKYIVSVGCIPPMCDLLTVMDAKIVQVALSGLENILKYGMLLQFHRKLVYFVKIEKKKCCFFRRTRVQREWYQSLCCSN